MNKDLIKPRHKVFYNIIPFNIINDNGIEYDLDFLKNEVFADIKKCTPQGILIDCGLLDRVTEALSEYYASEMVKVNPGLTIEEAYMAMLEDDTGFNEIIEKTYEEIKVEDLRTMILGLAEKQRNADE